MERDELEMAPDAAEAWPDRIYGLLKEHGVRQVALVPDAGHSRLIRRCLADNEMRVGADEDAITLPDLCLVPQAYNARRWGVDLASFHRTSAVVAELEAIPAVQAAHPDAVHPEAP